MDAVMDDLLKHARWSMTKTGYDLRARDGAILATVRFRPWSGYVWEVAGTRGSADTYRSAMRAARKALRDATHEEAS